MRASRDRSSRQSASTAVPSIAPLPFSLLAVVAVVVSYCHVLAFSSRDHYAVIAWIETTRRSLFTGRASEPSGRMAS